MVPGLSRPPDLRSWALTTSFSTPVTLASCYSAHSPHVHLPPSAQPSLPQAPHSILCRVTSSERPHPLPSPSIPLLCFTFLASSPSDRVYQPGTLTSVSTISCHLMETHSYGTVESKDIPVKDSIALLFCFSGCWLAFSAILRWNHETRKGQVKVMDRPS